MSNETPIVQARVRIINPDAQDYGEEGWIIGGADLEMGGRRGAWLIVRLDTGHELMLLREGRHVPPR